MKLRALVTALAAAGTLAGGLLAAANDAQVVHETEGPPDWAYPINPANHPAAVDDGKPRTLEGSTAQFTFADLKNFFAPPDWFPQDHPAMPPLVAHGAQPDAYACGFCHLPTGNGRPENANIAGLPAAYIVRQVQDMKSGLRKSALPDRYPQALMWKLAQQAAQDPGLQEAAEYFAAMRPKRVTTVVETDIIPSVEISHWIYRKSDRAGTETIAGRLVEVPDDFSRFEKRDGRVTYTAYVAPGTIQKGADLVRNGGNGRRWFVRPATGPDCVALAMCPRSPAALRRISRGNFTTSSRERGMERRLR